MVQSQHDPTGWCVEWSRIWSCSCGQIPLSTASEHFCLTSSLSSPHTCSNLIANPTHNIIMLTPPIMWPHCARQHHVAHVHAWLTRYNSVIIPSEARFPLGSWLHLAMWIPRFLKSHSRPPEHHRPAFAVYQLLIRLLTCYQVYKAVQCFVLPKCTYPIWKIVHVPPLKLTLHCYSCDPISSLLTD